MPNQADKENTETSRRALELQASAELMLLATIIYLLPKEINDVNLVLLFAAVTFVLNSLSIVENPEFQASFNRLTTKLNAGFAQSEPTYSGEKQSASPIESLVEKVIEELRQITLDSATVTELIINEKLSTELSRLFSIDYRTLPDSIPADFKSVDGCFRWKIFSQFLIEWLDKVKAALPPSIREVAQVKATIDAFLVDEPQLHQTLAKVALETKVAISSFTFDCQNPEEAILQLTPKPVRISRASSHNRLLFPSIGFIIKTSEQIVINDPTSSAEAAFLNQFLTKLSGGNYKMLFVSLQDGQPQFRWADLVPSITTDAEGVVISFRYILREDKISTTEEEQQISIALSRERGDNSDTPTYAVFKAHPAMRVDMKEELCQLMLSIASPYLKTTLKISGVA